jgi:hypothetical protein
MRFGGTELLVVARDLQSGNSIVKTTQWLGD